MPVGPAIPRVTAIAALTLPEISVRRYSDQVLMYVVQGTADITSITPLDAGQHVLFIFEDAAAGTGLTAGNNLDLPSDFAWEAGDTILLFCDGVGFRMASSLGTGGGSSFYQTVKDPAGAAATQRPVLKFTGDDVTVSDVGGETVVDVAAPADPFYQTIKNPAGSAATQRDVVKFTGPDVTVTDVGGETVVDIDTPADVDFYQTVKNPAGSAQTQRDVLKFAGAAVGVADTGGETVVTVTAATFTDPIIQDAAAADTLLDTSEQTIVTITTTPVAGNKVVKLTYVAPYFNSGTLTGVGRVKLYKNVNGGGNTLVQTFEIDRFAIYGHKTFVWFILAMANQSTVFTIKETISASGGSLYNASSSGNTASPARLTLEQY